MSYGRFIAILLLTLPLSMSVEAATIRGSVVSAAGGEPLENMTVAVYSPTGTFVTSSSTSSSGLYTISPIGAGSYRLVAYDGSLEFATSFYDGAPNFETSQIITVDDWTPLFVDFRLVRNGLITGTVTAAADDRELRSMTIAAYDSQGFRRATATSDADGTYSLPLPAGDYRVAAWDDTLEYAVQFHPETFTFAAAQPVRVTAQQVSEGIDFELAKTALITGTVSDRSTGSPLPNMTVEAWIGNYRAQQTQTDSTGSYEFRVPPTSLKLLSWDTAGIYATVFDGNAASFEATSSRTPAPGATLDRVDLSMVRGGRVEGDVSSASSGFPLQEMTVVAFNHDGSVRSSSRTDSSGRYSLLLPPGDYSIGAWDSNLGYLPRFYPSAREFEDASPITVSSAVINSGVDLLLPLAGRIRGLVTSSSGSIPLEGIGIFLYDLHGSWISTTITNRDGRFVVAAEPGVYRLVVADPQRTFATWYYDGAKNFETSATVTIVAADDLEIAAVLTVAARVDGEVRDRSTGAAIEGVKITAYDLEGERMGSARTDSNGGFSLLVSPGSYRIVAADPAHRYATSWYDGSSAFSEAKTILLGSGIVRPMDFDLEPQDLSRRRNVRRR